MKNIVAIAVLLFSITITNTSCKKTIEKIKEEKAQDYVVQAMTNGQWKMSWYRENGTDQADFNGYEFKYYENYTVDGIDPQGNRKLGNWTGNGTTLTTTCDFPTTAGAPLTKLNGTWSITKNSWTFVEAQQINGTITKTMRLDKK